MLQSIVMGGGAALFVGAVIGWGAAPAFVVGVVVGAAVLISRDGRRG